MIKTSRDICIPVIGLAIIFCGVLFYFYMYMFPTLDVTSVAVNTRTFENTSTWDPLLFSYIEMTPSTQVNRAHIVLPPPPLNNSYETRRDIAAMLAFKSERTPLVLQEIQDEIDFNKLFIDGVSVADYFDEEKQPDVAPLLNYAWRDFSAAIMEQKHMYNRVRPAVIKADIEPVIDVPHHPAYPSGHASQSYFIAEILSELHPEKTEIYFTRAQEIAHHREVAGVHYPGDGKAGKELAHQFFELLKQDTVFAELLQVAKESE